MPFAEAAGGRLWYEAAGAGPAVVLLHAGIVDSRMWDAQLHSFAERHCVVRYDLRGFGRSDRPSGSWSETHDLGAVMDAAGVERAALVGNSLGGLVAIDFAIAEPDRVAALVLVASALRWCRSARESSTGSCSTSSRTLHNISALMISADLLREARLRAGLTQAELGRRTDTPPSAISRWERGAVRPSLETLRELIRACGLELTFGLANYDDSYEEWIVRALELSPAERVRDAEARERQYESIRRAAGVERVF